MMIGSVSYLGIKTKDFVLLILRINYVEIRMVKRGCSCFLSDDRTNSAFLYSCVVNGVSTSVAI